MGDFNYSNKNDIDSISNTALGRDKLFLDNLTNNFLIQHVDKSTKGANILNLIISRNLAVVKDFVVGEH